MGNEILTLHKETLENMQIPEEMANDFWLAFWAGFMHYRNMRKERLPKAVELMYIALWQPGNIQNVIRNGGHKVSQERISQRVSDIKKISKYANRNNQPSLEIFSKALKQAFRHGAEVKIKGDKVYYNRDNIATYAEGLYSGVETAINEFWDEYNARVIIWTAGDSSRWKWQFYKVASSLNNIRRKHDFGEDKSDRLSIIAETFKLDYLQDSCQKLIDMGVDKIIFVEDKLKMLEEGSAIIRKQPVKSISVYIQNSLNNEKETNEDYITVEGFKDIKEELEKKGLIEVGDNIGMIIDFDDVLSNNNFTNAIWINAIVKTLLKNNWININKNEKE